jgi:hypothetical protein
MIIPSPVPVTSPLPLPGSGFEVDPDFERHLQDVRRQLGKLEVQQVSARLLALEWTPEVTGIIFHVERMIDPELSRVSHVSLQRVEGTPWSMGVSLSIAHREGWVKTFEHLRSLLRDALQQFPHAGDFLEHLQKSLPKGGFAREALLPALTLTYDQRYGDGAWHKDFSRHEQTLLQTRLAGDVQVLPDVSPPRL